MSRSSASRPARASRWPPAAAAPMPRRRAPPPKRPRSPSPPSTAAEQPITRFIRVSGTLTAQEDAEVAAESRRPRRRHPGRARQPRARRRRVDPDRADRSRRAGRAKPRPTPRRSRRGSASPAARRSTRARARSGQRARPLPTGAQRVRAAPQRLYERQAAVAVRLRSAQRADGSDRAPVRSGEERRRAAVPVAARRAARASRWRRRRWPTPWCARRLRARSASGSCRSAITSRAAPRWRRSCAIDPLRVELTVPEQYVVGRRGRPRRDLRGRRVSGRDLHRPGALRVAVGDRIDARADARGDRAERVRPAQAGLLRDRAHRGGREAARHPRAGDRRAHHRRHGARVRDRRRPRRRTRGDDRPGGGRPRRDRSAA